MVQSQELTSGVETDLLARLIDPNGTVHPYVNLTPWKDDQYRPRVAWDGSQFVVVWQDQRTDLGGDWSLEQIDARSDLMGMRISAGGGRHRPAGIRLLEQPDRRGVPERRGVRRHDADRGIVRAERRRRSRTTGSATSSSARAATLAGRGGVGGPDGRRRAAVGELRLGRHHRPRRAVAAYAWDFGDGETSTEADPTHLYTVGGPYVATLTVTDNGGAQTMQEVLVEAVAPNVPPVAVASSNITSGPVAARRDLLRGRLVRP